MSSKWSILKKGSYLSGWHQRVRRHQMSSFCISSFRLYPRSRWRTSPRILTKCTSRSGVAVGMSMRRHLAVLYSISNFAGWETPSTRWLRHRLYALNSFFVLRSWDRDAYQKELISLRRTEIKIYNFLNPICGRAPRNRFTKAFSI